MNGPVGVTSPRGSEFEVAGHDGSVVKIVATERPVAGVVAGHEPRPAVPSRSNGIASNRDHDIETTSMRPIGPAVHLH